MLLMLRNIFIFGMAYCLQETGLSNVRVSLKGYGETHYGITKVKFLSETSGLNYLIFE